MTSDLISSGVASQNSNFLFDYCDRALSRSVDDRFLSDCKIEIPRSVSDAPEREELSQEILSLWRPRHPGYLIIAGVFSLLLWGFIFLGAAELIEVFNRNV